MLPFVLFSYQEERQTQIQPQMQTPAPQFAECKSGEYGFSIYGDFLFWRPYTEDVTFAVTFISNLPDPATGRSIEPKFQWDTGFRIGTSYRTPFDMWKIDFHWTRFYSKAENSIVMTQSFGSTDFVVAPLIHNLGTFFTSAQAAFGMWNLYTNFIDASLSLSIPLTKTILF